ncbi:hypothetical protein CTAYLR_010305 [Chrysophaeum taylorii]|uniref:Uncharacterized protein n=1 Tax=Chrysophaeum taylorii TaxID=2483200 RepID=A0AAD7UKA9_9STRA|nr:hypothetical protein CTAYLR_010305 [Chrysophaeum taylorii]
MPPMVMFAVVWGLAPAVVGFSGGSLVGTPLGLSSLGTKRLTGCPVASLPQAGVRRRREATSMVIETVEQKRDVYRSSILPSHPDLVSGKLSNGLEYVILPNSSPEGRFEAHLEVFAGSADELDNQQGMAHLVEHVAYMGSRKRERLFGTGSQTNAYTDFHHTVFYACCPREAPAPDSALNALLLGGRGGASMLPRALDALCEVLCAEFLPQRVEKERAAVLSEMSMVNTIEYRVECQILRALHSENALARRFPIGLENQIRSWTVNDVMKFHGSHYRPDNALLYVVGDVSPDEVVAAIRNAFGDVPKRSAPEALPPLSLKAQSRHFPPILHAWSGGRADGGSDVPLSSSRNTLERAKKGYLPTTRNLETPDGKSLARFLLPLDVAATPHPETGVPVRAHVFQHELLQTFSFHMFAKRPVEPITTLADHRMYVMRRIALAALQVRLNVMARNEPLFSFVEYNHLDSAREACAVCSLDMTADAGRWEDAVSAAIRETRRMAEFGISQSELERFGSALITDSEQLAAMGAQLAHSEQLTHLMETIACEHTFMDAETAHAATMAAVESVTLDEVNAVAADVCAHVTDLGAPGKPLPSAIVACSPAALSDGTPVVIDNEKLLAVAARAAAEPIEPEPELVVPKTLMNDDDIDVLRETIREKPVSVPSKVAAFPDEFRAAEDLGVRALHLANGARVVVKRLPHEAQRGALRIAAAGGRSLETAACKQGAVALGARTLQEGGAFSPWSREQVELFCVDRLIMVEVACTDEAIHVDFQFPTPAPRSGGCGGLEAALQIAHKILEPGAFLWEEDALSRARLGLEQQHDSTLKSMEGVAQDRLVAQMVNGDPRFLSMSPPPGLTLDDVRTAVMTQFDPANVEVILVGDFDLDEADRLAQLYVGSVLGSDRPNPPSDREPDAVPAMRKDATDAISNAAGLPVPDKTMKIHVPDSDPRAVAYISGPSPNRAGILGDGRTLLEALLGSNDASVAPARWRHPLFPTVALALLQEVINRRLFSVVRERKQLTYDANFHFSDHERLRGGWYLVSVTAEPANAVKALDACRETLAGLATSAPPTRDNLESARRVVVNRHLAELVSNKYWCEQLTGTTFDSMPNKRISGIREYARLADTVTVNDLVAILKFVDTSEAGIHTCIATSGDVDHHTEPQVAAVDAHSCSHVLPRRR